MKKREFILLSIFTLLVACSSNKTYESKVFPKGDWIPINPEYFGIEEAKRIQDGKN